MNFLRIAERLASGEQGGPPVTLAHELCLHKRDAFAQCRACFSVCPQDAIRPGKPPELDTEACTGCLACLPVCPLGAYRGADAFPDLLQSVAHLDARHVELLCTLGAARRTANHGPAAATAIEIDGCLAGLGVGAYMTLLAHDVDRIHVRTDSCDACPWADLRLQIEKQVRQVRDWLATWKRPETISLLPRVDEDWVRRPLHKANAPRISRRDLLKGLRRSDALEVELSIPDGKQPLRERLRLLGAFRRWPMPPTSHSTRQILPQEAGFATLHVAATCSACGVCTRACPTGALELNMQDGQFSLTFLPRACIGCDICLHLCPELAITADHDVHLSDVFAHNDALALRVSHFATCARCRAPFAPADPEKRYCPPCEFRRKNPFGAQLPPGLRGKQPPFESSFEKLPPTTDHSAP